MASQNFAAAVDQHSPFVDKPRPATVSSHAAPIKQCALRLINDLQVLLYQNPPAVRYLAMWSQEFRRRLSMPILFLAYPEDAKVMDARTDEPDDATKKSAQKLVDIIQMFTVLRPRAVQAIERCASELLADQARHRIWERVQRLSPENVARIDAAVALLETQQEQGTRDSTE